jgi:Ca2+-binding EF-hand superfamily protein
MRKLISMFVATALAIGVAAADDRDKPAASADTTFKSLDRDADQRLSKTEVASDTMLTEHFAAVDADSDGYVTKREYSAHMKEMQKDSPKKEY